MPISAAEAGSTSRTIHRAAVIGAGGFIGTRLSVALTNEHVDTACFTRVTRALDDSDELSYVLHRVPVIYYLASSINPTLGEQYPERAREDHRTFAKLLARLACRDEPPTVVLTSSGGTVYEQDVLPPYDERSPVRAVGRYGAAKLALEEELHAYSGRIAGVILRLSNAYGPGQRPGKGQGVLGYWLRAALDGRPLQVISDPGSTRDYVYIDDVVDCMWRIDNMVRDGLLGEREPLVLNVGSGVGTSLTELVGIVRTVLGRDIPVQYTTGRELDRRHVWLDVGQAYQTLGWRPTTSLVDGVAAMWRWTRDQRQRQSVNRTDGAHQWY
ncbi:UDP-glucose 4-epimerase [Amycolatopsis balhimycina DSM 5908]|uniref:UDP-glucose 4-epimerase n=1 Tax=Amycolatopsis balhimycina DSM 5908 TaxID=1081091 RepID=A0A428WP58_AMYBA|nr:NAD-dependent epimerase/dehydratase family protein [Amycolatopsis balhimycina]RSM44866.1 UDP-glucose 4-epimerase [Amycolatopsis balhimycina DSM 5908]